MIRKGNFRFGIYTYNDALGGSWLALGLLALEWKLRPLKARYGFHFTGMGLFLWWGLARRFFTGFWLANVNTTQYLDDQGVPLKTTHSGPTTGVTLYNGDCEIPLHVYGYRKLVRSYSWLPWVKWTYYIVDLAQNADTYNPDYSMHQLYVSKYRLPLSVLLNALKCDPTSIRKMENVNGEGGISYIRYRRR